MIKTTRARGNCGPLKVTVLASQLSAVQAAKWGAGVTIRRGPLDTYNHGNTTHCR